MGELYIGLMSGTSLDGVDAALVEFEGNALSCIATHTEPYTPGLRAAVLALCRPDATIDKMLELDVRLGRLFARQIQRLLAAAGVPPSRVIAAGSHGQTIYHQPRGSYPSSLQIGDPNIIAHLTGITTVADFRRRDMAAGGQGAPLVPAFHKAFFQQEGENRVIVNIGGIGNITILPADAEKAVTGFDTGPGNVLLDSWTATCLKTPMDNNGAWAASGKIDTRLLERMLRDPFFQRCPPKSTGREYFNHAWLQNHLYTNTLAPEDVAATLCELTASTIALAIRQHAPLTEHILVCGGGVNNTTLFRRLKELMAPSPVESSKAAGIDPDWVEAIAFAWLAKQTVEEKPGNLPAVTGAERFVSLGGRYQG